MPLVDSDRPRAIERIRGKLREMQYLRGTGPVSQEFFQWTDETVLLLEQVFGPGAPSIAAFETAVGDRSPIYSQGIPPHGPWGTHARLTRAEAVLNDALTLLELPVAAARPGARAASDDEE